MTLTNHLMSQALPCPNCGSPAERHRIDDRSVTRTQCRTCDYLLITCQKTGKVIEFYAPGIEARVLRKRQAQPLSPLSTTPQPLPTQDVRAT